MSIISQEIKSYTKTLIKRKSRKARSANRQNDCFAFSKRFLLPLCCFFSCFFISSSLFVCYSSHLPFLSRMEIRIDFDYISGQSEWIKHETKDSKDVWMCKPYYALSQLNNYRSIYLMIKLSEYDYRNGKIWWQLTLFFKTWSTHQVFMCIVCPMCPVRWGVCP